MMIGVVIDGIRAGANVLRIVVRRVHPSIGQTPQSGSYPRDYAPGVG